MTLASLDSLFGSEPAQGFVETPREIVDLMVDKLFAGCSPTRKSTVLDPGCGTGAFIDGIIRWCDAHEAPAPRITGIEADSERAQEAKDRFRNVVEVEIREGDFLAQQPDRFDFVIGNPPYVPITAISPSYRAIYRQNYLSATGRFDLYILFFEQALSVMNNGGRLVFITPEKFLYVETTAALRGLLSRIAVEELHFLDEQSFGELVTYPLITTLSAKPPGETIVRYRDGATRRVQLAGKASSWLPTVLGAASTRSGSTLSDICSRISCGVATGADSVFVVTAAEVPGDLLRFAYPTISGREIVTAGILPPVCKSMLVPYGADGALIPEQELGAFREYLSNPARKQKLLKRTCVERKPWYAFHENPPLRGVLRPKLLCKDIGAAPTFVIDREGTILPRHSVYYIVPRSAELLDPLAEYLNSKPAQQWLLANCQRAANGFIRVQSHVLKQMPLPPSLAVNPADNARSVSRLSA